MRGKAGQLLRCVIVRGITPAYAGKSLTIPNLYTRNRDHPRVCGEKQGTGSDFTLLSGSPPRMRGKGRNLRHDLSHDGITPAYAGKRT